MTPLRPGVLVALSARQLALGEALVNRIRHSIREKQASRASEPRLADIIAVSRRREHAALIAAACLAGMAVMAAAAWLWHALAGGAAHG